MYKWTFIFVYRRFNFFKPYSIFKTVDVLDVTPPPSTTARLPTEHSIWTFCFSVDATMNMITSDPPETYAVIDLGSVDLPDHICCPRCRRILPTHSFVRRATKAQSLSRGYAGNYLLRYVGKNCLDCQPQPKALHQLYPQELERRVASGNYTGSTANAEAMLKKRKERQLEGIRSGTLNRMKKRATLEWKDMLTDVCDAVKRFKQQARTLASSSALTAPHSSRSSPSRITYTTLILELATQYRTVIKQHIRQGKCPTTSTKGWQDLLTQEERRNVQAHFDAMPPEESRRMRHTAVLNLTQYSDYVHYAPDKTKL